MTATRVLWTCSDMSYALHAYPISLLEGSGARLAIIYGLVRGPGTGAAYRLLPATVQTITAVHGHLRRIGTIQTPVAPQSGLAFPIAYG